MIIGRIGHVDLEPLHFRQVHVRVVPIRVVLVMATVESAVVQVLTTVSVDRRRAVRLVRRRLHAFVFRFRAVVGRGSRGLQQAVLPSLVHHRRRSSAVRVCCAVDGRPAFVDVLAAAFARAVRRARDVAVPRGALRQARSLIVPLMRQTRVQHEHHARHYGQRAQDERVDDQVAGHAVHGGYHQTADADEQHGADGQQKRFLRAGYFVRQLTLFY